MLREREFEGRKLKYWVALREESGAEAFKKTMGSSSGLRIEKLHKLTTKSEKRKEKRNGSVTIKGILGKGTGSCESVKSIGTKKKRKRKENLLILLFLSVGTLPPPKSNQSKATSAAGALLVVVGVQ